MKVIPGKIIENCHDCDNHRDCKTSNQWIGIPSDCPLKDAPEWKDKPDSIDDLWFFEGERLKRGTWQTVKLLCIPLDNNEGCYETAFYFMDRWVPRANGTWMGECIYYEDLKGKWQKAIVPTIPEPQEE